MQCGSDSAQPSASLQPADYLVPTSGDLTTFQLSGSRTWRDPMTNAEDLHLLTEEAALRRVAQREEIIAIMARCGDIERDWPRIAKLGRAVERARRARE